LKIYFEGKIALKLYGIFYFHIFKLTSEWGFKRFLWEIEIYKDKELPIERSRFSTPEEIKRYLEKPN
jgi:hypothetical protein